jgi:phosphoglycerate dehydrogenase-like enzyme
MRCVVLDDYQDVALTSADWSSLDGRVEVRALHEHLADRAELAAALAEAEIVVAMRERTAFDADLFARLPRLRLLVTTGMRNASIDLDAAAAAGVTVCGTAGSGHSVPELTFALLLNLAWHVREENDALRRDGRWQSTVGRDLHGATLGVLGLGRIGVPVARIGAAFGMNVLAWSRHLTAERAVDAGAELAASKRDLLERSDFVTIHLALSDRTRGLIGEEDLRAMRPGAFLVNTSRAPIVDPQALLRALREGWIAGAGLDVFETEPLPADDPLRTLPNVLGTPHLGYVSEANYRVFYREIVENIAAFLDGAPVRVLGAEV